MGFAQAQSELSGDSLIINKPPLFESKPILFQQFQGQIPSTLNMKPMYNQQLFDVSLKTPNLNFPSTYNLYTPTINLTDNLYNRFTINNRSWINTSRTLTNYYGLGGITSVGANYNLKINDFTIISGGAYGAKYNLYNQLYNNVGVNGNIKFLLSDKISMNIFGQYSGQPTTDMLPLMSTMYPQSYYGGSFEFKVTDNWGVITGASREFDVLSRKWVTRPFIMPIFYNH